MKDIIFDKPLDCNEGGEGMSDKLKPCPFCGNNDISTACDNCIECSDCGANIVFEEEESFTEMVKAWNRRIK